MKKAPLRIYFKIIFLITALNFISTINASAQLSGTYYIDNTATADYRHYKSFTAAVNDLNGVVRGDGGPNSGSIGIGGVSGNVTFNVKAAEIFTEPPVIITYLNPNKYDIIFRKDPNTPGVNPILKGTGGSNTIAVQQPPAGTIPSDAIIEIFAGDSYTIDGIDLTAANNTVEIGLFLYTNIGTDGASNNTLKNSVITLDKTNPNVTYCVLLDRTSSTPTSVAGESSNNLFYNNTVQNATMGFFLAGGNIYDQNNEIGFNTITNLDNNPNVSGQMIGTLRGIFLGVQENTLIYNNTIGDFTMTADGGGQVVPHMASGIMMQQGCREIWIYNNTIQNIHTSTTSGPAQVEGINGSFQGVRDVSIYNNTIINLSGDNTTLPGSLVFGIDIDGQSGSEGINIYNNTVTFLSSAISRTTAIQASRGYSEIYNNTISNLTAGGGLTMYGIFGAGQASFIHDNTISNITATGITSGGVYGIITTATTNRIVNNSVSNLSLTTVSANVRLIGILSQASAANVIGNTVGSLTASGTSETDGILLANSLAGEGASSNILNGTITANSGKIYGINVVGNAGPPPVYLYNNTMTATITGTGTTEAAGIVITNGGWVYNNTVGSSISANSGVVYGIKSPAAISVFGNTIGSVNGTTASGGTGATEVDGILATNASSIYGNIINGVNSTASTNSNVLVTGIKNAVAVPVYNNTISNVSLSYSGSGTAEVDGILATQCQVYGNSITGLSTNTGNIYGINAVTTSGATQHIFSNTITTISSSAATGNVIGINAPLNTTVTPININNNIITDVSCSNTSATTIVVTGLSFSNITTGTNTSNIFNNVISNVRTLSSGATAQVTGIIIGASGASGTHTYNIFKNKIFTISTASSTTGTAVGMQVAPSLATNTTTTYDNMIYDINADNSVASTLGGGAVGLYVSAVLGTEKVYYNTIYLNGAGPGAATTTTQVSSAFYCASGATLDLENNIEVNTTTINAGGSSFIYAFWYAGSAAPGTTNSNLLYAGTSSGAAPTGSYYLYNQNGTKSQSLANYKTAMAGKADNTRAQTITVALSSFFVSATSPVNVHILSASTDAFGKGVATAITPDFDGDTRSGTPSIGADEVFTTCTGHTVVNPAAPTVGTNPVCGGTTAVTMSTTSTANVNYNWSFSNSGITLASGWNTNSITVNIPSNLTSGSYTVSVTEINGCGTSTVATKAFTVNGVISAGTISATNGGVTVCRNGTGYTYTTTSIPGATAYTWALSPQLGTITGGAGTQTITVSASTFLAIPGYVTVAGNFTAPCTANGPLSSFSIKTLPVPLATPGPVTSPNNGAAVCQGQTGLIYSVANIDQQLFNTSIPGVGGTDYIWSLPSGATIVGATNKNRIVVNYSGSASSGNVSVILKTINGGCPSASSANFAVTVSPAFTLSGVTQAAAVCAGAAATINVTGLPASRTFTAHYTIAGGPNQSVSITSNGSGAASFSITPALSDNGKSLEITDLTDATGTTYFSSNNSVTLAVIGPPNAPVAIAGVNISDPQFTARWNSVAGATGYFLDVATDNAFSSLVSGYNDRSVGLVTSFVVSGLSAGTTYYYRVRVAGGTCSLTSSNSNTISVTTTGCPAVAGGTVLPITSVICSGGSQLLTVTGTTGGTIQWQVSTDNSHWSDISGATGTTYAASPTQKSYFRSETLSPTCYNATSNTVTVDISATPAVTITNVTSTTVTITWSPYGSGQYDISWSGAGGTGSAPAITTNTFTIGSLNANSDLLVTVTPVTPSCGGVNATSVNTHTLCAAPTVTNVTSTGMIHGFKVNWTSVSGATSYWVYYRDLATSSAWSFVDTSGTHKSINVLYANHTFAVYVVAKDCPSAGNLGNASTPTNYVTTNPLSACSPAPTVSGSSACPNQIHVDITGTSPPYNLILRRISPSLTAGASYPISTTSVNITVGTQYAGSTWEVFATKYCGATGVSAISNVILVTVKPGCPQLTNVVVSHPTCNGFTVSWNGDDCAGLGISGYQLLIKKTGTSNFLSYPVGTATHTVVGWLPSDNTWNVEVMSVACNGATSALSNPDTIATLHCGRAGDESLQEAAAGNIKESITVYPNPTQGQFWIDVNTTDNGSMVKTELISQLGEVIQTNLGQATGGHLNQVINTPQGLASGIYFVRTSVAGNVYVNRIMISKE